MRVHAALIRSSCAATTLSLVLLSPPSALADAPAAADGGEIETIQVTAEHRR